MRTDPFNIVLIAQQGRFQYEAALFLASLRACDPGFSGRVFVAEPRPGPRWSGNPGMGNGDVRALITELGGEIVGFDSQEFGEAYPQGNKIEALGALPAHEPFIFFDSDTLITGALSALAFDFSTPAASMRREGTWPKPPLYGPGYGDIWKALYDRFGLDFAPTLDRAHHADTWQRYLYFSAGWFFGPCPQAFGRLYRDIACSIRDDVPEALAAQKLYPWLDQIALPLVITALGGGRPGPALAGLDGDVSCHWRVLPLLYARESDHTVDTLESVAAPNKIKKVLKQYEPFKRMIYQGRGRKVRALFDRDALPRREQALRKKIREAGLWMR